MGPNTDDEEMMRKLVKAGMDVARFNFSHGDHEEQKIRMDLLKKVRKELKLPIAILLDTKGPEIRTGILEGGQKVYLEEGSRFTLTTEQIEGNNTRCSQTYKNLPKDVKGGELGQKKGINVPNVEVKLPAITEQDKKDILFGIEQGIDFIAASFVRNAEAIKEIKELLRANGGERIDVIAKIENAEGVHNIDKIIKAADGVMVARGDLGVEIPAHKVPHIQKMIIRKCNESYKPVITATQMLDSMMRAPRPTRAEVTDVANAIYDGTDAIMLSGETAMGKYPEQAVQMMVKIAESTEPYMTHKRFLDYRALRGNKNVSSAVGVAAVQTTENLGADCIVTPTISGQTARLISNFRPKVPIYAVSPNEWARRKMQIYWGVTSVAGYEEDSTENIISHAMYIVRRENLVKKGDIVVFTAGDPATNMVNGEGAVTNIMQVIQAK